MDRMESQMSRKDYVRIAGILRKNISWCIPFYNDPTTPQQMMVSQVCWEFDLMVNNFVKLFQEGNPKFDESMFRKAVYKNQA